MVPTLEPSAIYDSWDDLVTRFTNVTRTAQKLYLELQKVGAQQRDPLLLFRQRRLVLTRGIPRSSFKFAIKRLETAGLITNESQYRKNSAILLLHGVIPVQYFQQLTPILAQHIGPDSHRKQRYLCENCGKSGPISGPIGPDLAQMPFPQTIETNGSIGMDSRASNRVQFSTGTLGLESSPSVDNRSNTRPVVQSTEGQKEQKLDEYFDKIQPPKPISAEEVKHLTLHLHAFARDINYDQNRKPPDAVFVHRCLRIGSIEHWLKTLNRWKGKGFPRFGVYGYLDTTFMHQEFGISSQILANRRMLHNASRRSASKLKKAAARETAQNALAFA